MAQEVVADTVIDIVVPTKVRLHTPTKAAVLSAVLPGAGQIYNKQYWKAPLAIGGLAYFGYIIKEYNTGFKDFRRAYAETLNGQPISNPALANFSGEFLNEETERLRKNRDISAFTFIIIYAANIVDAAVWAHLFYFDVSENVSLNIRPSAIMSNKPILGVSLALNFSNLKQQ